MIINRTNRFLYSEAPPAGPDPGGGGTPPAATPPAGGTPPTNEAPPDRPEYIAEKFWKDGKPDVEGMGRSYQELESAFSKKNPHAADLPKDAAGYQLKPDNIPEGLNWSDDAAGKFADVFHKNGIGAGAAKNIVAAFMEIEEANLTAAGTSYETGQKAAREKLVTEWGGEDAYTQRTGEIEKLVTGALGEDAGDVELFNNPRVVGFLGKVVDLLGEDAKASLNSAAPTNKFADAKQQADAIMKDPNNPEHKLYRAGDKTVVNKVMGLLQGGG